MLRALRVRALLAVGFAAMLLSLGTVVAAKSRSRSSTKVSSAFCAVTASAESSVASQDGFTEAWLDIDAYVCGSRAPRRERVASAAVQVRTVAAAVARALAVVAAVAVVAARCRAEGTAEVRAQAYAAAQAEATAIGEAVAAVFVSAGVCRQRRAAVEATSRVAQEVVAHAAAEWTGLYILSDGGEAAQTKAPRVTSEAITARVAEVLSSVTASIRASADDGCSVRSINAARVGDYFAVCELDSRADITHLVEVDAVAEAGVSVAVLVCDGDGTAELELDLLVAETAVAVAEAVAQAETLCRTAGGADNEACGLSVGAVQKVARAQATAFAEAVAEAETCDCATSVSSRAAAIGDIWAEAATNAYAETCSSGTGSSLARDFRKAFAERSLTVTSRVIVSAIAEVTAAGGVCRGAAAACAAQSARCAPSLRPCAGEALGGDVVPCCDPEERCVNRRGSFRCRNRRTLRAGDKTVACNLSLT